jgi:hypothetical protein
MSRIIALIILATALLLAPLAEATTCRTECYTDASGITHCTTRCSQWW